MTIEKMLTQQVLEAVKACFEDPQTEIATLVKPFTPADGWPALENVNSPKVVVNRRMQALYFSRSIIPYQRNKDKAEWLKGHVYYKHIGWPNRWNNYGGWKTAIPSRWASAKLKPSASTHRPTSKRPKLS